MIRRRRGLARQLEKIGSMIFALLITASGLSLTLAAPAEAGSGGRGYRSHGGHSGHGYRGYGNYRGHGRYYGGHRSHGYRGYGSTYGGSRSYGSYGKSYGSYGHRGYPSRHYYYSQRHQTYRHYYPYKSYSRGHRTYPQPIYYQYPLTYHGGYATNGAILDPGVGQVQVQQSPVQPQPIYIVIQPPEGQSTAPAYPTPEVTRPQPPPVPAPSRTENENPGQVFLRVEPRDASVYLDDDLLGSGESLAELGEPLVVRAGVHVLEVLHPGYEPQRLFFGMPGSGKLQIDFNLDGDHRGRKSRMKTLD